MRPANPLALLLILPVLAAVLLYIKGKIGREAGLRFPSLDLVRSAGAKPFFGRRFAVGLLRGAALVLFVIALSRPQTGQGEKEETRFLIDIVLSLDTSGSMATLDFHPENRLAVAKTEAKRFVEKRPDDRIGVVIFAKNGVTLCPLTTDRGAVLQLLDRVRMGMLEDGTAIGVGLATAVNRLRETESKSKVVVLLTDGVNNSGEVDPLTAAKIAKKFGVRVYTIGMGREGESLMPVNDPRFGQRLVRVQTEIDEKLLAQISEMTGGRYFRAQDTEGLKQIFNEINRLEKTEVKVERFTRYEDHFRPFLWAGLMILMLELLLAHVVLPKLP